MLYCEKAYMITREELTKNYGSHDLYGGTDFVVSVDETDES